MNKNIHETNSTFAGGIVSDLNPLTTPATVLTDALNATLLTFNANEMVLQNDMGNTDLTIPNGDGSKVALSEGFIPIGVKEYGGIIYIVSSNPSTNETEIGSFPGPKFEVPDETTDSTHSSATITTATTIDGINQLYPLTSTIIKPGDKFKIQIPIASGEVSALTTNTPTVTTRKYYRPRLINLTSNIDITDRFKHTSGLWFNTTSNSANDIELVYPYDLKSGKLGVKFELENIDYFAISNWIDNTTESGPNLPTLKKTEDETIKYYLNFNTFDILEPSAFKCTDVNIIYTIVDNITNVKTTYPPITYNKGEIVTATSTISEINNDSIEGYRLIDRIIGAMSLTLAKISNTSNSSDFSISSINSNGTTVTSRGLCWNTVITPTISNYITINGAGTADFSATISPLVTGLTYYVRAYVTNMYTTSYSNEVSFTISASFPTLTTNTIVPITYDTVTSGGNITSNGGSNITSRGVCFGTSPNPTTAGNKTVDGIGSGNFVSNILGLSENTTYYIRAYAINTAGIVYGNELSLTTAFAPILEPVINPVAIYRTSWDKVELYCTITNIGASTITNRGFIIDSVTYNLGDGGGGISTFIKVLTALEINVIYEIIAFATNSQGTTYTTPYNFTNNMLTNNLYLYAIGGDVYSIKSTYPVGEDLTISLTGDVPECYINIPDMESNTVTSTTTPTILSITSLIPANNHYIYTHS